jgi:PD-(D/E)XK nuclease superfamily
MERNPPALIARTEGLSGEPLLTQWLAHLLRQPVYQGILIPFLAGEDIDHATLCNVTIRDEEGDSDGGGRPDIEIGCEAFALIVENKLDAGMTKNQPRGYLQLLKNRTAAKKVLTFLVPAGRKKELHTTLAPYTVKSTGIGIYVCTWEDLAEILTKSFAESELIREFSGDIQRRCKVQSPLTLDDLKIASDVLAGWLHQRELLKAIRETLSGAYLQGPNGDP